MTDKHNHKSVANHEFCEQMGQALVKLGTNEALSCMGRLMCAIAHQHGAELMFECDLGTVTVTPAQIPQKH